MNSQVQISNSDNNQPSLIFTHPTTFYYRPPNDCYHYRKYLGQYVLEIKN
ncbi:hypothetical protein RhiirA5_437058 [Rhizophagus irregularis]|uniref:Uncharacterized protein n=1 Tax=Rhizophagus irregularis TaxID=588596 RepID=A0A2N0NL12_9GLOM|nr:hypothetical protein RhiirA5_437058 [Rhizophagus irregularis]